MDEVATHNSKTDCWVVINGKVCNLTEFMNRHPGGATVIVANAGKDASKLWNKIHSRAMLDQWCPECVIGHLVESKPKHAKAADSNLIGA